MIFALFLAAAAAPVQLSAIDAERAFAADAQRQGQWTAFRKWSTADALMFVPQPTKARDFLKGRKDPPASVFWWPGRSYVSCDGKTAINTGPWVRGYGKSVGYFTTVWVRQRDGGWKWVYDAGDEGKFMRDEGGDIAPVNAPCPTLPLPPPPQREVQANVKTGGGSSADGTLTWGWTVARTGERNFFALMWDGKKRQMVIEDKVAAPK
ncbi:MAG: hypothetical protein ABIR25_06380 [Sphingomicrobium sp.]